jgi:hypothetical protein
MRRAKPAQPATKSAGVQLLTACSNPHQHLAPRQPAGRLQHQQCDFPWAMHAAGGACAGGAAGGGGAG